MGLKLGSSGLGTGPLSGLPADAEAQAVAAIDAAYEAGIRFFDTAPFYGRGQGERRLGVALADRPRSEYVLSTKVGRSPVAADGRVRAEFDFSDESVCRSLDESLFRLGVDAVDIALIHDPDDHWEAAIGEAYPALDELRRQGVVKAIGVGMNQWQMPARFVREADIDVVLLAGRYSLLDQSGAELLQLCAERDVAVIAAGVFNSGVLAAHEPRGTYNYAQAPPEIIARARRLATVCERHGVTLPHAALAFPRQHPAVTSVLFGAESAEEVRRNVALLDSPVPQALWADLAREGLIDRG
jgi:D-threo-aldose 1-dehydrogenase